MNIRQLAGLEIDEYKLVSLIGQGGMSAVYRAYQEELDRYVAIKILSDQLAQDPNYIKRFQAEAKMAAKLEHPHIVPVYDFGVYENLSYVAMRLLDSSLTDKMYDAQPMSMNDVLTMLEQIAKALDYAHSKGIVHRDVKPGNIMFDEMKIAYLVDFGIAKATQQADAGLTVENVVLGTPSYMSPELWRGETPPGASDQYALAVLVFQVLTGKLPYQADSSSAVMYKHLNEEVPLASDFHPGLSYAVADVIQRGMHKDSRRRYPLVSNFVNALAQAINTPASAVETQERQVVSDVPSAPVMNPNPAQQTVPVQTVPRPPQVRAQASPVSNVARPKPRQRPPRKKSRLSPVMIQVATGGIIGIAIIFLILIIGLAAYLYAFGL